MTTKNLPAPARYAAALLIAALALALKYALGGASESQVSFIIYVPAVIASAWLGGLGPGLLTTGLCAGFIWYFMLPPAGSFGSPPHDDAAQLGTFLVTSVLSSVIAENLHRAQRHAERSAARLQIAQDHSLDGFTTLQAVRDASGKIVDFLWEYANPAAARLLGRDRERLVGRRLLDGLPGSATTAELLERCARVVETGEPLDLEQPYACARPGEPEEDRRWFRIMVVQLQDGIAVHFGEITGRKRAEAERARLLESERRARAQAEGANRLKDEFLATLSHELRTPLNAILGWSQLLQAPGIDPEKRARGLQAIERNARGQAQIIEDILDVSRIITGKVRIARRLVDAGAIVGAAVESLRPTAEAKGVALDLAIETPDARLSADATRLQQVCWNLVSNAIKFTPAGGTVRVAVAHEGDRLRLEVSDTGQGIAPDFLPFVFDRFRQADSSTTRRHGGVGLGLSIVRHLVELHGGHVSARSEGDGKGATFEVTLPITGSPGAERAGPAEAGGAAPGDGAPVEATPARLDGLRVLVVDDQPDAAEVAGAMLQELGARPWVASSAREALRAVAELPFDVIVSDLGMPDEDGYALIRELRALPPAAGGAIPVVAMTAYARREDRQRALAAGFQAYLAKPVAAGELASVVRGLAAPAFAT
ncbi:transcriptional regulator [Sorangium cellulosum]|uniref:histidine kinase n=1 Tax=Sorangium cellulosum TaxID=56 RepID=A0A4P2Q1W7_SORCE|nr:ATP-binding protein [Sorangium cellulosum]AUX23220.1 transcriptional regulator [Sorangium cellulosum]